MNKRIIKYGISLMFLSMALLLFGFISYQPQASAEGWWSTVNEGGLKDVAPTYGQSAGTPSPDSDIRLVVARIIRVVLELLGVVFLVIIIIAGFKWMTAGGDEAKIEEAKKQLTNGIIGLAITLVAFSIATFVFNQLQFASNGMAPITW